MSFDRQLSQPRDVLFQELDGESVLLHVQSGQYFGLNPTGHAMWQALTAADSVQKAFDQLLTTFNVTPEQLEKDLTSLVDDLVSHELLEDVSA